VVKTQGILAEPAVHERYHLKAAAQREERRRHLGKTGSVE